MALTDTAIRGAKPGTKPFKLYDREGLFLLINPSASKLWRWRYKFDGKEKHEFTAKEKARSAAKIEPKPLAKALKKSA